MNLGIPQLVSRVMPLAVSTGLFVSLCTVQQPSGVLTSSGAPDQNWLNVGGLVNIPCMNAPEADNRLRAKQEKHLEYVEGFQYRHMLLDGYYPVIAENSNWRAVVDGVAYDITGVESDSQLTQTRLLLQIASV